MHMGSQHPMANLLQQVLSGFSILLNVEFLANSYFDFQRHLDKQPQQPTQILILMLNITLKCNLRDTHPINTLKPKHNFKHKPLRLT